MMVPGGSPNRAALASSTTGTTGGVSVVFCFLAMGDDNEGDWGLLLLLLAFDVGFGDDGEVEA